TVQTKSVKRSDNLDAQADGIVVDGTTRTVSEQQEDLREELGITRRGMHVDTVLGAAARRSGMATDAYETTPTPAWAKAGDAPEQDARAHDEPSAGHDEPGPGQAEPSAGHDEPGPGQAEPSAGHDEPGAGHDAESDGEQNS